MKQKIGYDFLIWSAIIGLLIFSGMVNYYYSNIYSLPVRIIAWIFVIGFSFFVGYFTNAGKSFVCFANIAFIELKKVVWPTRDETMRTSFIIFVMVVLVGLFLWLADSLFLFVITKLAGY